VHTETWDQTMAKHSERAPRAAGKARVTTEAGDAKQSGANLGFEAKLWLTADKLEKAIKANLKGLGYGG
jgi:hypothetical protein